MACEVIKFLDTEEVSVAPINWIRGNKCLWPPKKLMPMLAPLIEKGRHATPSDAWEAFRIELKGVYGNLIFF